MINNKDLLVLQGQIANTLNGYLERNATIHFHEAVNRLYQRTLKYHSPTLENDKVIFSGGRCRLFALFGMNTGDADCWIHLYDSSIALADGAIPEISIYAPAGDNWSVGVAQIPWALDNGIYVCASSTAYTKTALSTSKIAFYAQYLHEGAA